MKKTENETTNLDKNLSEKIALKKYNETVTAVILAGGQGTRMASPLPKVLHPVAGDPMIHRILNSCQKAQFSELRVVVGYGAHLVKPLIEPMGVKCFHQANPLGTGDAVKSAQVESMEGIVVILNGDHPLITAEDLTALVQKFEAEKYDLAVATTVLKQPKEFGRIVRHQGKLMAIVEVKDASSDTLKIKEINTGVYVVRADLLKDLVPKIRNNNLKKEYYLTDLVGLANEQGYNVGILKASRRLAFGVNNQIELAQATKFLFKKNIEALMLKGVLAIDPSTVYVESHAEVGPGTVIYPNVQIKGKTKIGSFSVIESNSFIIDSEIGDSVQVKAGSYIEKSKIHSKVSLGPYARIRPKVEVCEEAHIGNFVELKNVKFGARSKAGHLTYLGDAEIGEDVNVGCGTITCNYAVDRKKYLTKIGNRVFIGSDSQFVAPVEVGDDAIIASGSTITEDVPAKALGIARGKQVNKENYADKINNPEEKSENKPENKPED